MWIFYKVEHFIISFAVTWYALRWTGLSSFLLKSYYILLMQFLSLYLTWKLVYLSITSQFDINVQIKNYNWSVLCMIKLEHARKSKVDNEHLKWNKEKNICEVFEHNRLTYSIFLIFIKSVLKDREVNVNKFSNDWT